jgi:hypothetical protein
MPLRAAQWWISIATVLCLALGFVAGAAGTALSPGAPRVTMIGDSVASSLDYVPAARTILGAGIDLRLELAPCRRVAQSSCPYLGERPPTLIDLVPALGSALGQTVIVSVGYNDFAQAYADDIQEALAALLRVGVTRVLWMTLHEQRPDYAAMNVAIHAAAAKHPELTVVDWQVYARSHPDWFQAEGIHLTAAGAIAMATLVHNALVTLGIPLPTLSIVTSRLRNATVEHPYSTTLAARGGTRPLRWQLAGGRLARGLHLLVDGRVVGVPRESGSFSLLMRVTDARQESASRRIRLLVRLPSS